MMRTLILLSMLLLLSSCQVAPVQGDQEAAYLAVKPGSTLVLTRDITIPSNQTSVYVQDGKITTYNGRDQYYPNCKFELYPISDKPRVVSADTFAITRVARDTEYVSNTQPQYAGPIMVGDFSDGGPTAIIYSVTFSLRSDKQPDVFRLTCQEWNDPVDGNDLTLAEVRRSLLPLFTLDVK